MMKVLVSLLMLIPLCFISEYWLVQFMFFMLSFMFMFNISMNFIWVNVSYFLGVDLLSFSLILLSF